MSKTFQIDELGAPSSCLVTHPMGQAVKLTLTQKGLLFVLAPLAVQLGFLATLAQLNAQTEQELKRAFHSGQISDATNKLVHDMFEMVSLSPGEFAKTLYSEGNENAISKAKSDLD